MLGWRVGRHRSAAVGRQAGAAVISQLASPTTGASRTGAAYAAAVTVELRAGAHHGAELRERFQHMLNAALTEGRFQWRGSGLGRATIAAVSAVADDHPDASVDQITAAYDAFAREHGAHTSAS